MQRLSPARLASVRQVGAELAIIVAGVVIALSFDGAVGWWRDRALVREARANITQELRDNRADLGKSRGINAENKRKIDQSLDEFDRLVAAGKGEHSARIGLNTAELDSTSWDTAQTTGAIRHMPYAEVKRYTNLYTFQREFLRMQETMLEPFVDSLDARPTKIESLSPADLSVRRKELMRPLKYLRVVDGLGRQLLERYDQTLAPK